MSSALDSLIVCDIDGCLSVGKMYPFDLEALVRLKALAARLSERRIGFTLCTGRPQPYAEALAQVLDLRLPLICENGTLRYYPVLDSTKVLASPEALAEVEALRRYFLENPEARRGLSIEPGKECTVSLIDLRLRRMTIPEISGLLKEIRAKAPPNSLIWTNSNSALDIIPRGFDKSFGVAALLKELQVAPGRVWGIGDSLNDLPFLRIVGHPSAPANAAPEVKAMARLVSDQPDIYGVLDIMGQLAA